MYRFQIGIDKQEHDNFVAAHKHANLLQSSAWANIKQEWTNDIVGVYEDDTLVASSLVLIKALPLGFHMFYTPRGPVLDYTNKDLVVFFMKELKKYAAKQRCLFIKMDPSILIKETSTQTKEVIAYDATCELESLKAASCIHLGYPLNIASVIQPRFQANVKASPTFEVDLPRHTKRLMKDAIKHNVRVVQADASRLHEFAQVVAKSEERKKVSLRSEAYFSLLMDTYKKDAFLFLGEVDILESLTSFQQQLSDNELEIKNCEENSRKKLKRLQDVHLSLTKMVEEFSLFKDTYENKVVVAGVLSVRFGNQCEMLYAGMNDDFKKFMPQYLIYADNMKYAFDQGCQTCNMGGVEGNLQDGLTKFKSNFNPTIEEFIGEFDLPVNRLLYKASQMAYKLRKKRHASKKETT